jgi:hypothetical protein
MKQFKVSEWEQTCSEIYFAVPSILEHLGEGHGDDGEYGTAGGDDGGGNEGCPRQIAPY